MIGCLCIHGFTGDPSEVEPLVDHLKKHTEWKIVCPVLPGHGEASALKGIQYEQWIEHAERELQALFKTCETVYVIGFSMGGIIASYLAAHYPLKKLILLSAAALYMNPKQLIVDIAGMVKDTLKGTLRDNELFLRYKRKIIETPVAATLQFRKLVASVKPILYQVNTPTLIAQGECDGIVPLKSAYYLYDHIGTADKKLLLLKDSKHLICHCDDRDQLFNEIVDFLICE